jgi:ferric-dicitrate binding protein FerR (iron transport regulator)
MIRFMLAVGILCTLAVPALAQQPLGSVASLSGDVDITVISSGKKFIPDIGTPITDDYKIRTGNRSFVELILNDGSKVSIKEVTVLNISNLKQKEQDPPTKIRVLTGKLRITVKKLFKSDSLLVRTPSAIAGVRGTDFGIIATNSETKVIVYEGEVETANSDSNIIKSFMVREGEEVSILKDSPPTEPRLVPNEIRQSWFEYYTIDETNRIIIRTKKEQGIIDKLIRKKNF